MTGKNISQSLHRASRRTDFSPAHFFPPPPAPLYIYIYIYIYIYRYIYIRKLNKPRRSKARSALMNSRSPETAENRRERKKIVARASGRLTSPGFSFYTECVSGTRVLGLKAEAEAIAGNRLSVLLIVPAVLSGTIWAVENFEILK